MTTDTAATSDLASLRKARSDRYLWKAAALGYPPAEYEIGYRMQAGRDMPPDPTMAGIVPNQPASAWLHAAAAQGYGLARTLSEALEASASADAAVQARRVSEWKAHDRKDPRCKEVVFSGIASAGWTGLIDKTLSAPDIEDIVARNPITCDIHGCNGVGYFRLQRARLMDWSERYYQVDVPVDFNTGRRNVLLRSIPSEIVSRRLDTKSSSSSLQRWSARRLFVLGRCSSARLKLGGPTPVVSNWPSFNNLWSVL